MTTASLVRSDALLAHLRATQQVGPDDWERCSSFLRVTRETTVGEIMDWQNGIRYTSLISLELCKADDCRANNKTSDQSQPAQGGEWRRE